ncbi:MAG TPA: sugar phosphate isomerase/epimerase family protein [Candidatus Sulfopaludibacter sp.]|nr:sugar phosphate isomerase/epimerase family protein [Candidatus Sulfopaludibacter sp.]
MTSRRGFLKAAAAVAAAGAGRGASSGMYVSLNGSLTGGRPPWPEFARLAARVGFGGVDVNLNAAMKEGLGATRALFAETKIKASNANLPVPFNASGDAFQAGVAKLDEAARFASAIGCPCLLGIIPPASLTPMAEFRPFFKARVVAVAEVLRKSNIKLSLEFLGPLHFRTGQPYEFIWRMNDALAFAKECGSNVGLTLDVWHWYHAGATRADIVAAGASRIVHLHLSDCKKLPPEEVRDNQRVLPGEGVIDLVGFLRTLKQIGYQGGISPEPIGRIPKDMPPEEGARLGLDTALAVMRKAGV